MSVSYQLYEYVVVVRPPSTDEGTIYGNAADTPAKPIVFFKKLRRVIRCLRFMLQPPIHFPFVSRGSKR